MEVTKEAPALPIDLPDTLSELLGRCCSKSKIRYKREKLTRPVHDSAEGVVYAADGHIAVRVPYTESLSDLDMREYDGTMSVVDNGLSVEGGGSEWEISGLRSVLEDIPKSLVYNDEECGECDGSGRVEASCPHCGQWYQEDCDACGGSGTLPGLEVIGWEWSDEHVVRWGERAFNPEKLALPILGAAAVQGVETGVFHLEEGAEDNSALVGRVGEIEVLIMPVFPADYTTKHDIPESARV